MKDARKEINELVKDRRDRGENVKIAYDHVYDHVYIENKKFGLNENRNGLVELR